MGHIEEGGGENEEEAIPAKEIAKNLKRQSTCVFRSQQHQCSLGFSLVKRKARTTTESVHWDRFGKIS